VLQNTLMFLEKNPSEFGLNVRVILPVLPGGIGRRGHSTFVQPQEVSTLRMKRGWEPVLVRVKVARRFS